MNQFIHNFNLEGSGRDDLGRVVVQMVEECSAIWA